VAPVFESTAAGAKPADAKRMQALAAILKAPVA
jgi:hypothetical protein